jgi:cytochrome P450
VFDPSRYSASNAQLMTVSQENENMVSTFGHGRHACPGERFALMMGKMVIARLVREFDFESAFAGKLPPPLLTTQMGAVGRAAVPCPVKYVKRAL